MKFIRFEMDSHIEFGVLKNEKDIIVLNPVLLSLGMEKVDDMNQIFLFDNEVIKSLELGILNWEKELIDINLVKVLTPIENPKRNIFCLGKNYVEHAKELEGMTANLSGIPKHPIYFSKAASPPIGPNDEILLHSLITDGNVDYEVELGIIIGKKGVNIKAEDVEEYIFGYTIINDISARSLQVRHTQWFRGKCLDSHCPIGPVIVHRNELSFPIELDLKCLINGEIRQFGNTKQMIFDIPTIISDLSRGTTLYPGDIIATGTPSGVGMGFVPPKYLKDGDIVECTIEKIGVLTNIVKE